MNIFLWILQILIALHTLAGAIWKLSNSEQTIPALSAIPHDVWKTMSSFEILCSLCLILPAFFKTSSFLVPLAATAIAAEMLLFCRLHFLAKDKNFSQVIYWLVVAAICAFIACGRLVYKL